MKFFLNNKTLVNITSLGSATLLNAVLAFIVGVFTRNILGPEKYGLWLTVSLIFTFAPIFQLGVLNAMNREVPFYLVRKDQVMVQRIREYVFSFIFTIPLLIIIFLLMLSGILFFTEVRYEYKLGLFLASIIVGLTFLSGYAEMYYKSEQDFKNASRLIMIKSISNSVLTLSFVYLLGYPGLFLGLLISLLIEIVVGRKIYPKDIKIKEANVYKSLIKIGFPILVVGLVWSVMIAVDRIIIAIFLNPVDLGNYGVGMLVFSSIMLLPQVISQVYYPKIVGLVSSGSILDIKIIHRKVNLLLAVTMLFVVTLGYLFLPDIIRLILPEYIQGIKAAQILLIGVYPLTLVTLAACYFNSTNKQKIYLSIQLTCIILNIILSYIFLQFEKTINSVALATSISFTFYSVLMNLFFILESNKEQGINNKPSKINGNNTKGF